MKITFTRPYEVAGPSNGIPDEKVEKTSYQEGQTLEASEASANHFITRGVAEETKAAKSAPKPGNGK